MHSKLFQQLFFIQFIVIVYEKTVWFGPNNLDN